MNVCKTDLNKDALKSLVLQFQLTLELSQIKEILSVYSELFVLIAKYGFIFENPALETRALCEDTVLGETGFFSQDPARDGVNWWNYCNSSPLTCIDFSGEICYSYFDSETGKYGIITFDKTHTKLLNLANNILDFYPIGIGEFGKFCSNSLTPFDKLKVIDSSLSAGHIIPKEVNSILDKIGTVNDVVEITNRFAEKMTKEAKIGKMLSSAAKFLGIVSDAVDITKLGLSLIDSNSYIIDNLVLSIYENNLMANSRNAVEKNYDIARESINSMIKNGNISLNKGDDGNIYYKINDPKQVNATIELFNKDRE